MAFLGSVRICMRESSSSARRELMIGRRPTSSGMMPNFTRSWGTTSSSRFLSLISFLLTTLAPKPMAEEAIRFSMIFSMPSKAPPQMKRMLEVSIWMNSCWGCLRPPWGGTLDDRALQDLQQGLLHPLAADVPGDGGVFRLAGDLVDLVDVDDAALGPLHVEVRGLDQLEQDVFHVLAHIAGLGEGGGVGDGKGHVQDLGQGLGQQGLAHAGGAQQQDVALLQLHIAFLWAGIACRL